MIRQITIVLVLFLVVISCDKLSLNKKHILENTPIAPIDFSRVDAYPLLPECEQMTSRTLQKKCFYQLLSKRIEVSLQKTALTLTSTTDTIKVKIKVSSKGIISVSSIITSIPENEFMVLDSIIKQSINKIPQIKPAIKAGIPVTTMFVLPIVSK